MSVAPLVIRNAVYSHCIYGFCSSRTGVELKNVKMSMNPFCENAMEEAVRLKVMPLRNSLRVDARAVRSCTSVPSFVEYSCLCCTVRVLRNIILAKRRVQLELRSSSGYGFKTVFACCLHCCPACDSPTSVIFRRAFVFPIAGEKARDRNCRRFHRPQSGGRHNSNRPSHGSGPRRTRHDRRVC